MANSEGLKMIPVFLSVDELDALNDQNKLWKTSVNDLIREAIRLQYNVITSQ